MQSRRDQVQAQSYVLGRLTSALVLGEPEAIENPHRRVVLGTTVGIVVALLIVAAATVFGLLKPGSATSWRNPGSLIVEKDTGARYVLADGALRPVINYTSAVLLFGKRPPIVSVSSASLRSVPRGLPVGIVGAPDALPDASALTAVSWSVCAMATIDPAGSQRAATLLILDRLWRPDALAPDDGLVARTKGGQEYLVWSGRRFAVTRDWIPRVFGFDSPAEVEPAWLDQVPPGPDLGPLTVPGRGQPGPPIDGRPSRIGQVYVSRVVGTSDRYFLLQRDGLSVLTPTTLALALGDPDTVSAYGPDRVRPIELTATGLAATPLGQATTPTALPATPPRMVTPLSAGQTWCVQENGDGSDARITLRSVPYLLPETGGLGVTRTAATAASMAVAAGVGGVARLGRAGQANGELLFLITDAGVKFPVSDSAVTKTLGYEANQATVVSPALLALLPTGPLLDPAKVGG